MNATEFLNIAQDQGLISDNVVTLEDVAEVDLKEAVKVLGEPTK